VANATLQAHLLQKLGIAVNNNADNVDAEAVEKLLATFAAPLSPSKEEALQALFLVISTRWPGTLTWPSLTTGRTSNVVIAFKHLSQN
jgi:hypothetical protein